ncbi:MAG: AbrB/MazE/SpoVT family DNA-binding domain-containing protein [Sulfolobaceae archaeon]
MRVLQDEEIKSKEVETRKVQKLGSSSLFVTLPKKWISKWNVKPGDKIIMEVSDDGTLKLIAEKVKNVMNKRNIKIDVDSLKQPLLSIIPCLYALGYDEILLLSKKGIDRSEIESLLSFSKQLVGAEVTEAGNNKVKIECLLDTEKLGLESLLRRLLNIISKKIDEIILLISDKIPNKELQVTKDDLRRVYLMLLRRILGNRYDTEKYIVRNFIIISNITLLSYAYNILEKITSYLLKVKLNEDDSKKLREIFQASNDILDEIIMTLLFPSVKRIINGKGLISQVKNSSETLSDEILRNYIQDLVNIFEEALSNSSCVIYLEEQPWLEKSFSSS